MGRKWERYPHEPYLVSYSLDVGAASLIPSLHVLVSLFFTPLLSRSLWVVGESDSLLEDTPCRAWDVPTKRSLSP